MNVNIKFLKFFSCESDFFKTYNLNNYKKSKIN